MLPPGAGWNWRGGEDGIFVMGKTGTGKRVALDQHKPEIHALGVLLETLPLFLPNRLDQREGQLGLVSTQLARTPHQYVLWLAAAFPSVHGVSFHTEILIKP